MWKRTLKWGRIIFISRWFVPLHISSFVNLTFTHNIHVRLSISITTINSQFIINCTVIVTRFQWIVLQRIIIITIVSILHTIRHNYNFDITIIFTIISILAIIIYRSNVITTSIIMISIHNHACRNTTFVHGIKGKSWHFGTS